MTQSIVELITSYGVSLQKSGNLLIGLCPFHSDKNKPNLTVYESTNSWFCYACSFGGSLADFVAAIEGITRAEALRKLGAGSTLDELTEKLYGADLVEPLTGFNLECDISVSKLVRDHLRKFPEHLSVVMPKLKEFDQRLEAQVFSLSDVKKTLEDFRKFLDSLYNKREEVV